MSFIKRLFGGNSKDATQNSSIDQIQRQNNDNMEEWSRSLESASDRRDASFRKVMEYLESGGVDEATLNGLMSQMKQADNEVDATIDNSPELLIAYKIVCPYCDAQEVYGTILGQSNYTFNCNNCKQEFATKIVNIRAKREKYGDYSVRIVELSGVEDVIEFHHTGYLELRAGDEVVFTYCNDKLKVIQNMTINKYTRVI
jgi:transcription elongation factor Elf1